MVLKIWNRRGIVFGRDGYFPLMGLGRSFFNIEAISDVGRPLSREEKEFIFRAHKENLRADWESGRRDGYRTPRIKKTYDMRRDVLIGFTFPSSTISLINIQKNLKIEPIPKNKYKVVYTGTPTPLLLLGSFFIHEMDHLLQIVSPLFIEFWWENFIQKTVRGDKPEPPKSKIPAIVETYPTINQGWILRDRGRAYDIFKDEFIAEATSSQLGEIFDDGVLSSEPHREAVISDVLKIHRLVEGNWIMQFTDFLFLFRGWDIEDVERFIYEVRRNEEKYNQLKKVIKDWNFDLFLVDVAGIDVDGEFDKRIGYLRWLENQFEYQPSRQRIQTVRRFMEEARKEKTPVRKIEKLHNLLSKTSLSFVFHRGKLYINSPPDLISSDFVWGWDQSIQLFVDIELALRLHKYPPSRMLNMLKRMECPLSRSPQWRDTCGVGEEDPHITKWIQYLTDRS